MKPAVVKSILEMRSLTRKADRIIGFVPTMGYLHQGHLSLVKKAREQCDLVVVSIFVNPTQFSPDEDLDSYPRDFKRDFDLLSECKVDYIFYPDKKEMYSKDFSTWVEVKGISEVLCGKSRPTHFRGVSTVVLKLVNITNPNYMYMGEKDFQQIAVLKRMLADLNFETHIVPCPIIREPDGLAMSSRNKYLDQKQRKDALCLQKAIIHSQKRVKRKKLTPENLLPELEAIIHKHNGKIDYIEFRDQDTLQIVEEINQKTRLFLAVYIGKTRLIDNSLFY